MHRRALVVLLALALPLLLAGCVTGDGALVGEPAPDFSLTTLDGAPVNLSSYAGRWLVLDLMATWCGPCKVETAHLKEVQRAHGDDVAILSVGADADESAADLARFRDEYGTSWEYAADPTRSVASAYNLRIIPKMILVDPEGVVRFEGSGEVYPQTLARVLDPAAPARTPVLAPALAALAAGAAAALNPYGASRREAARADAARWRVALAVALAAAVALALAAYRVGAPLSARMTWSSLLVGVLALAAAFSWPARRRRRDADAPPPARSALGAAGDLLYYGGPGLLLALALALRGQGWLAYAAPLAAALAGAALALALEERRRVDTGWGAVGLAATGLALAALAAWHGLPT